MARYSQNTLNRQTQIATPNPTQMTEVVARPVDLTVTAVEDNSKAYHYQQLVHGLGAFADGLNNFNNSFTNILVQEKAKEEMKARQREAKQERLISMETTARADVAAKALAETEFDPIAYQNALSKEADPQYQAAFRQNFGEYLGRKAALNFQSDFQDQITPNITPEVAQQWATDYFKKQVEGINDPLVLTKFADVTSGSVLNAVAQATSHAVKAHQEQRSDMLQTEIGSFLSNTGRPQDWLQQIKQKSGVYNLQKSATEEIVFNETAKYAIAHGDVKVLEAFTEKNPDGTPSFQTRFPGEFEKVRQQAENAFAGQHSGEVKALAMQVIKGYEGQFRVISDQPLDIEDSDLIGMNAKLEEDFQTGILPEGKYMSFTKQLADLQYKRHQLMQHLPDLDNGGYSTVDLSEDEKVKLFEFKVKGQAAIMGNMSPENLDRVRMETAMSNSIVAPTHVQEIVSGYRSGLPKGAKQEDVTPQMIKAAGLALTYYQNDPQGFIHSIKDEQAQNYYINLANFMEHSEDGNLVLGILNAKQLQQSDIKIESVRPLIRENVEKAVKKLDGLFSSSDAENSAAARQFMIEEAEISAKRGVAVPEPDVLAAKYKASHTLINDQWVNTRSIGRPIKEDEAEQLGEAIKASATQQLLSTGIAKAYNLTPDEIADASFKLFPKPITKAGEETEFVVVVDGKIMLPGSYNLTALRNQYVNNDRFKYYSQQVTNVEQTLKQANSTGSIDQKVAEDIRLTLKVGKDGGAITGTKYRELTTTLGKIISKSEVAAQRVKDQQRKTLIMNNELVKPLVEKDPVKDLAWARLPKTIDPDVGLLSDNILDTAKSGQFRPALAMAVFGATTKRMEDGVVNQVGIGYDLDDDPKTVAADLKRVGFPYTLDSLKARESKLSVDMPGKLLNLSLDKAVPMVKEVLTEDTYNAMTDNQRSAFEVLALASGDKSNFNRVVNHMKSGDFQQAAMNLVKVPGPRRMSALSYIRAMAYNPLSFGNLIRREPR